MSTVSKWYKIKADIQNIINKGREKERKKERKEGGNEMELREKVCVIA